MKTITKRFRGLFSFNKMNLALAIIYMLLIIVNIITLITFYKYRDKIAPEYREPLSEATTIDLIVDFLSPWIALTSAICFWRKNANTALITAVLIWLITTFLMWENAVNKPNSTDGYILSGIFYCMVITQVIISYKRKMESYAQSTW